MTELAALGLVDRVLQDMDRDETPFNIYLDPSKAFDTMNHSTLMEKLKYYGINHKKLSLFESYLTNCKMIFLY